jgi:hypothetical protein
VSRLKSGFSSKRGETCMILNFSSMTANERLVQAAEDFSKSRAWPPSTAPVVGLWNHVCVKVYYICIYIKLIGSMTHSSLGFILAFFLIIRKVRKPSKYKKTRMPILLPMRSLDRPKLQWPTQWRNLPLLPLVHRSGHSSTMSHPSKMTVWTPSWTILRNASRLIFLLTSANVG